MWCEVAIAMLCYNAKLQTEINKRLGKKNYKHDTLTIGGKRGGGGKGEGGGDIVVFQGISLPMNCQGRGEGVESLPQPFSSSPKLMTNQ